MKEQEDEMTKLNEELILAKGATLAGEDKAEGRRREINGLLNEIETYKADVTAARGKSSFKL